MWRKTEFQITWVGFIHSPNLWQSQFHLTSLNWKCGSISVVHRLEFEISKCSGFLRSYPVCLSDYLSLYLSIHPPTRLSIHVCDPCYFIRFMCWGLYLTVVGQRSAGTPASHIKVPEFLCLFCFPSQLPVYACQSGAVDLCACHTSGIPYCTGIHTARDTHWLLPGSASAVRDFGGVSQQIECFCLCVCNFMSIVIVITILCVLLLL